MGIHCCEYCVDLEQGWFNSNSSGDVTLRFSSGRSWVMPDMIVHYIADHGWQPPAEFVEDVLSLRLINGSRVGTKGVGEPVQVGYLSDKMESGPVSWELVGKLSALMEKSSRTGQRRQTRSS